MRLHLKSKDLAKTKFKASDAPAFVYNEANQIGKNSTLVDLMTRFALEAVAMLGSFQGSLNEDDKAANSPTSPSTNSSVSSTSYIQIPSNSLPINNHNSSQLSSSYHHSSRTSSLSKSWSKSRARRKSLESHHSSNKVKHNNKSKPDLGLHNAVLNSNYGLVKFILDQGQSVNSITNGMQPIHVAAGIGDLKIFELLVNRGGDINGKRLQKNITQSDLNPLDALNILYGSTPLHFAVANNQIEIVKKLVNLGCNPYIKDEFGVLPIEISIQLKNTVITNLLTKLMKDFDNGVNGVGFNSTNSSSNFNHNRSSSSVGSNFYYKRGNSFDRGGSFDNGSFRSVI
ncbi:hypothetical protein HK099_005148 [Clydaea vesicula]|uniref:Uncharacterized protein n=1 Tax=Clydaea vesicula TaxID=447962 RepID=A0AAD5Y161_9FUNG|nr:hypothetical protein HK099_005148 [Clydaea vesicula]